MYLVIDSFAVKEFLGKEKVVPDLGLEKPVLIILLEDEKFCFVVF